MDNIVRFLHGARQVRGGESSKEEEAFLGDDDGGAQTLNVVI